MAEKFPRGTCSACGADVAVLRDGTAYEHYPKEGSTVIRKPTSKVCPGSGRPVARR